MPTAPVHTHTFNANDFRPVLHSTTLRKAIRATLFGTALGLIAVPQLSVAAETTQMSHHYAIPAGQLDDVLNQFARQAGITLSSTPQLTQGLQSNGLQGQYPTDQALRQLLNGSGLEALSQTAAATCCRHNPRAPPCHCQTPMSGASPLAMHWAAWRVTTPPIAR